MRWNIDQELTKVSKLLGEDGMGVSLKRVLLSHSLFSKFNLKVDRAAKEKASMVWVISIPWGSTFLIVCGKTLHEANINLRRLLRKNNLMRASRRKPVKPERKKQRVDD